MPSFIPEELPYTETMSEAKQRKVRKRKEVRLHKKFGHIFLSLGYLAMKQLIYCCLQPQESASPTPDEATKEEYSIARWMRNNVPVKKTKFLNHTVEYFICTFDLTVSSCGFLFCRRILMN